MTSQLSCRFCNDVLTETFIDLGRSPLSNSYLTEADLNKEESFYPLHPRICKHCFLVQLPEFESPADIFTDYAYFSSYSDSLLQQSKAYTEMMIKRFNIDSTWQVVEIASNDGYLLQYFSAHHIPVLGVEPARNVAEVAKAKGIPTESFFFGKQTAEKMIHNGKQANLIIANNVLAHVPNLNDFVAGMKILLAPQGIITIEFPHLLRLMERNQFDTIYHEHFSYFSLLTAQKVFAQHELCIFDVEEITAHGGSLRIFVKHANDKKNVNTKRVDELLTLEKNVGLDQLKSYHSFSQQVASLKQELLSFLLSIKKTGKKLAGYGAPAKANTLLNYCGIGQDILPFTVDRSPHKQGHFLPGTRIPILHPDTIREERPDYLLLFAWNLKDEIMEQMAYVREWQGKFVIPIPHLQVI